MVRMSYNHYYTKTPKEFCPECGGKMKPEMMDEVIAHTYMDGVFYHCGNKCEYLELRKVTK